MGLATETRQNIGIFVGDKVAIGIVYMHAVALIKSDPIFAVLCFYRIAEVALAVIKVVVGYGVGFKYAFFFVHAAE